MLLYSSVSIYVGLYGSGLFNFGSHLTLFTCFLGFDVPTSFIFIENVFVIIIITILNLLAHVPNPRLAHYYHHIFLFCNLKLMNLVPAI